MHVVWQRPRAFWHSLAARECLRHITYSSSRVCSASRRRRCEARACNAVSDLHHAHHSLRGFCQQPLALAGSLSMHAIAFSPHSCSVHCNGCADLLLLRVRRWLQQWQRCCCCCCCCWCWRSVVSAVCCDAVQVVPLIEQVAEALSVTCCLLLPVHIYINRCSLCKLSNLAQRRGKCAR